MKTAEELARREKGPVDVGMTICITDVDSGKAVAYKGDGERFLGSKYTVKMVTVRCCGLHVVVYIFLRTVASVVVRQFYFSCSGFSTVTGAP